MAAELDLGSQTAAVLKLIELSPRPNFGFPKTRKSSAALGFAWITSKNNQFRKLCGVWVAGDAWRNVRNELDRMHLVTMETKDGRFSQRTTITPKQAEILRDLRIKEPGRYLDFEPKVP